MSIIVVKEDPIVITQAEKEKYLHEYTQCMSYYSGPQISFETWLRSKLKESTTPVKMLLTE